MHILPNNLSSASRSNLGSKLDEEDLRLYLTDFMGLMSQVRFAEGRISLVQYFKDYRSTVWLQNLLRYA